MMKFPFLKNCVSFGDKIFDKFTDMDRDEIKNCDILFCFMFKKKKSIGFKK